MVEAKGRQPEVLMWQKVPFVTLSGGTERPVFLGIDPAKGDRELQTEGATALFNSTLCGIVV